MLSIQRLTPKRLAIWNWIGSVINLIWPNLSLLYEMSIAKTPISLNSAAARATTYGEHIRIFASHGNQHFWQYCYEQPFAGISIFYTLASTAVVCVVWYLERRRKARGIQVKLDPIPKDVKKNRDFFRHWKK